MLKKELLDGVVRIVFSLGLVFLPIRAEAQTAAVTEKIRIAYPSRGMTVLPLRLARLRVFFSKSGSMRS